MASNRTSGFVDNWLLIFYWLINVISHTQLLKCSWGLHSTFQSVENRGLSKDVCRPNYTEWDILWFLCMKKKTTGSSLYKMLLRLNPHLSHMAFNLLHSLFSPHLTFVPAVCWHPSPLWCPGIYMVTGWSKEGCVPEAVEGFSCSGGGHLVECTEPPTDWPILNSIGKGFVFGQTTLCQLSKHSYNP